MDYVLSSSYFTTVRPRPSRQDGKNVTPFAYYYLYAVLLARFLYGSVA